MRTVAVLLASGFGAGYLPVMPGTWGTFLAAAAAWFLFPGRWPLQLACTVAALVIAVPASTAAESVFGKKDDGRIVIDEIAGYWVSLLAVDLTLTTLIASVLLFRVFDVIKPFFIRRTQSWRGGWGVTADDFFAGLLTNAVLQLLRLTGIL